MSGDGRADSSLSSGVLRIVGGRPLVGRLRVPGDKSISHRALLLGAMAPGTSVVRGLSDGDDVRCTARAVEGLGAAVEPGRVRGPTRLHAPAGPLDLGNSGTSMRLLAGLVASWPWVTRLVGDASLSARPMDRVARPLALMGARVEGRTDRCLPPLEVHGGQLHGIRYEVPEPSAQVKSCVLLAGLRARGETTVREVVPTRRHTEELLALAGAEVVEHTASGAHEVTVRPSELVPFELDVPGDPSQSAFWVVAACIVPDSEVTVEGVYTGTGRRGYLDVLRRMGADLAEVSRSTAGGLDASTDITARTSTLRGTVVDAAEITGLDEVPVLAVAAARAAGATRFRSVGELRVKESDRLVGVCALVRAFGAEADVEGDDLVVVGTDELRRASVDAGGDHRMAMAAAVAASAVPLGATPSVVSGWDTVATSYPAFAADLELLTSAGATRGRG